MGSWLFASVILQYFSDPSSAAFLDDYDRPTTANPDDPLCQCYDIRLNAVQSGSSPDTICYHYSVKFNIDTIQCSKDAVSIILGICEDDDDPFTHHSLDEAVMSVRPDQYAYAAYPDEHHHHHHHRTSESDTDDRNSMNMVGLRIKNLISSWMNEQVIICMDRNTVNTDSLHTIDYGTTSHSVQYLMNDNSVVTCRDHPDLVGLPCRSYQAQKPFIDDTTFGLSNDLENETANDNDDQDEWIPKLPVLDHQEPLIVTTSTSTMNHNSTESVHSGEPTLINADDLPFVRIPIPELIQREISSTESMIEIVDVIQESTDIEEEEEEGSVISNEEALIDNLVDSEVDIADIPNTAFSIKTREWIRFAFIFIMIFIGLNVLFCTFMALRQSGALDAYFDKPATGDITEDDDDDDDDGDEMSPLDLEDVTESLSTETEYVSDDFEESEDNGFSSPRGDEIEGDTTEIEDDDEEGEEEEEEEFDPLSDANMTPIGRNDITPHGAHDTAISIIDFGTMVDHVHRKELSQSVPEMEELDHRHCRSEPAMFSPSDAGSIASMAHTFHE